LFAEPVQSCGVQRDSARRVAAHKQLRHQQM
jgi:hypothetical protein